MFLQFIHKGDAKLAIEVYNENGDIIFQRMLNRYTQKDVRWLSELAHWDIAQTNKQLQQFCESTEDTAGFDFDLSPELLAEWTKLPDTTSPEPFTIQVRELQQLKKFARQVEAATPDDALRAAFEVLDCTEPLIEWTDRNKLCCLDVDYHYTTPPTYDELVATIHQIKPAPFAWHPSHGGGAKLYYHAQPGYTALELAAVAGLQWIEHCPTATFDLVKTSRHPCYVRSLDNKPPPCASTEDIHYIYGGADISGLKRLLAAETDTDDINEFLESRGWTYGQLLPHTECPIHPEPYHKDTVFIGEKGVYCHHCQAKGLGGRTPGFVPYSSMIRGVDNRLRNMVRHFVHLEHARIVLENLYPHVPANVLDIIYGIMLKVIHTADDPRVNLALHAGRGFVRIRGQWVTVDGTTSITDGLQRYVQSLPAVLIPREDGGFALDIPALTALSNAGDISEYGYYDISFIRGTRIYGQKLQYPHFEVVKVVGKPEFQNCPPTYLTMSRRMPEEEAWKLLDQEFPGINRTYIKLLICTKGASEGRLAQCPFLMITGVASAGKSTSVHIAAGLCGDKADEPIFYPDVLRFRASLMDGAKTSGFLCVNEVFKMADRSRISYVQALDPMLSLTEDSRSHVLYVGSVPFGRLPVFVLTDIECPREILQDYQLARRFTFYRLDSAINWTDTLVHRNIRPHEFRCISAEHALAADSILSYIIDEFFSEPIPLTEMVKRLGITHFEPGDYKEARSKNDKITPEEPSESPERAELKANLKRFYSAVCLAPKLAGQPHESRYNPKWGWKLIDRSVDNEILNAWNDLADGPDKEQWTRSRLCSAEDWARLLNAPMPVVLEVKTYQGGKRFLYVRFRSTDSPKYPTWINGEFI